ASAYGNIAYINNKNAGAPRTINLMIDEGQWHTQLDTDLARYYEQDPRFRVCIVSQSSTKVVVMETELKERYPHLNIKRLIGSDSGETKRQALEDINETHEDVNVFLYSPVSESGVDITVNVKKYMVCSAPVATRSVRLLQMINRCRRVEDPNMDFSSDSRLKINSNYNFWKYA
ncbi:MAG: helicase-related protein, partial [Candidatus Fonsibacter sp.]